MLLLFFIQEMDKTLKSVKENFGSLLDKTLISMFLTSCLSYGGCRFLKDFGLNSLFELESNLAWIWNIIKLLRNFYFIYSKFSIIWVIDFLQFYWTYDNMWRCNNCIEYFLIIKKQFIFLAMYIFSTHMWTYLSITRIFT